MWFEDATQLFRVHLSLVPSGPVTHAGKSYLVLFCVYKRPSMRLSTCRGLVGGAVG